MKAIEILLSVTTTIIALITGIAIGKKTTKKQFKTDEFIAKYYDWFSTQAEKGIKTDKLKAMLLSVGTKKQANAIEKYYYKQKTKRLKEEIKQAKIEAIKKQYLKYLEEEHTLQ